MLYKMAFEYMNRLLEGYMARARLEAKPTDEVGVWLLIGGLGKRRFVLPQSIAAFKVALDMAEIAAANDVFAIAQGRVLEQLRMLLKHDTAMCPQCGGTMTAREDSSLCCEGCGLLVELSRTGF